jgi:hypothetical protein
VSNAGLGIGKAVLKRNGESMDCSGRYVFFPVRKTGFCLSHSRGCLDGGEFCLNLSLCSYAGFGLRYLIPLVCAGKVFSV